MKSPNPKSVKMVPALLWSLAGILFLGLIFARAAYPEYLWLTIALGIPLVAVFGALIQQNRKALRSRTAAYGLNSAVTVLLVVAIVGVVNFLSSRYPLKADLTKNKLHTMSDQTAKLMQSLKNPVKATLFAKIGQRDQLRPLLDNYKSFSTKFEVEYVDPDREPTRAKTAGIKKYGTLLLQHAGRDTKVEDVTEEKLTNAMIKLLKEKSPTFCTIGDHGEKNFEGQEADGYDSARKALVNQAYEVKKISLIQEGKVPATCDAIAIIGPTKSFFEPEVKALREFLDHGGRALFALDVNMKGGEFSAELMPVLDAWNIQPTWGVIVDPLSKMLGVDAAVPIVASYSKAHAITKDFQANSFFPFARPLEIKAGAPASFKIEWIAQTTPKSWGVTNAKEIATGEVKYVQGRDKMGPLTVGIAVEGKQKDSKATRDTRIVVFGSSLFASNNYARFGGNIDLFLNAASWLMEDESLISIRTKEEGAGTVEMSQKAGQVIFLITVFTLPLLIAVSGVVIWIRRRKM